MPLKIRIYNPCKVSLDVIFVATYSHLIFMSGPSPPLPPLPNSAFPSNSGWSPKEDANLPSQPSITRSTKATHRSKDEGRLGGALSPFGGIRSPPAVLVRDGSRTNAKNVDFGFATKDLGTSTFNIEGTPVEDDPRLWSPGKKVCPNMCPNVR